MSEEVMTATFDECDWPEDVPHENGDYENHCGRCHIVFRGHKRRVFCRRCARPTAPQPEEKQK